ncbi:hypothetical protein CUMW_105550 [Citrus unshiu]|uniref:Protein kinase domain-containing protein n=1 Tax=Citrus unshiu TaxID=55188 RepID=A0A2H5P5J5_CITUN|nr:hypothetical protein CUMW_105550 [Citrus unshiu]
MQCGQRLFLVDLSCHSGILLMAHVSYLMFFILSYLLLLSLAQEQMRFNLSCPSFSCGKFRNINFPYSIRTHPECGFCLVDDCDKPVQKIQLGKNEPWLSVTSISADQTVTLYDQVFQRHLDNRSCESFKNISLPGSPSISFEILSNLTLFKCPTILGNIPMNFNMSCDDSTIFYNHPDDDDLPSLPPQCSLIQLPVAASKTRYASDLFRLLTGNLSLKVLPNWRARRQCIDCPSRGGGQCLINSKGYLHCSNGIVATASYECNDCLKKRGHCHFDDKGNFQCENERTGHEKSELKLGLGLGGGSIVLIALLSFWIMFYRKFSSYDSTGSCLNIETFLRNHGSLAPRRYSYADIKKMTNSFKYKLGQGGYGSVYKGKLIDGRNVAVKVLNDSKGNGEEFINEVASISRTSHVNVVTLLGFCFEGRRRALIYEFVSSGSLEKFIYRNSSSIENHKLTWETLLQIAVGIARGLEYLHLGCSTRILHFDIKPHNILLDEDFWS